MRHYIFSEGSTDTTYNVALQKEQIVSDQFKEIQRTKEYVQLHQVDKINKLHTEKFLRAKLSFFNENIARKENEI